MGPVVGVAVGEIGWEVKAVGEEVEGPAAGILVVVATLGFRVGSPVGIEVGSPVGPAVFFEVGWAVGVLDGLEVGWAVGALDGFEVG